MEYKKDKLLYIKFILHMSQEELISLFEKKFGKSKISANGKVNRDLWIYDYEYPLPNSITSTGDIWLQCYKHPLPNSIKNINGYLYLRYYNHPLPDSIKKVNGSIWVDNDYTGLPDNIHEWEINGKIKFYI